MKHEGYPAEWAKITLMVSPEGEMYAIGGDREIGDGGFTGPFTGLERIKAYIGKLKTMTDREWNDARTHANENEQLRTEVAQLKRHLMEHAKGNVTFHGCLAGENAVELKIRTENAEREVERLKNEIGIIEPGEHPDEQKPRAQTWLQERKNWAAEVKRMRVAVKAADSLIKNNGGPIASEEGADGESVHNYVMVRMSDFDELCRAFGYKV